MKKINFKLHWSFIILAFGLCFFGRTQVFLCCIISVLLHEFGHALVAKRLGYSLNTISLMPYGACLSGNTKFFKKWHETLIIVAGPLVNLLLILLCLLFKVAFNLESIFLKIFLSANFSTLFFNLLPIFPLDGGRVMLSLLKLKLTYKKAQKIAGIIASIVCSIFVGLFILSYFFNLSYMLGINCLFLIISAMQENNEAYYKNLKDFQNEKLLIKQSAKTNKYKVNQNKSVLQTYKIIDKTNNCEIFILNNNNLIIKKITLQELKNKLFESKYNLTLKQAFCE